MVDQRPVGLVADGGDQRDFGGGRRAHHRLVVEAPEIFQAAAAPRHDDDVRAGHLALIAQRIEARYRRGDLIARAFALHLYRPDEDMNREAVGDPVTDVADDGAGGRGDDADDARQEGQGLLARLREQSLGLQHLAPFVEERHQGSGARRPDVLDDDLIFGRARIGGQAPRRDDFEPFFRLEGQFGEGCAPDDGIDPRLVVLQGEIGMARGMGAAIARHLAAKAHMAEGILDRALQSAGDFRHREFGDIGGGPLAGIGIGEKGRVRSAHALIFGFRLPRRQAGRGACQTVGRSGISRATIRPSDPFKPSGPPCRNPASSDPDRSAGHSGGCRRFSAPGRRACTGAGCRRLEGDRSDHAHAGRARRH